ncbi:MAG: glycosyltransferase family 4 protein [Bacteroidota bacterium]|nr:glycosyltransferase family 4 protein [Bacteroidota bacterium]
MKILQIFSRFPWPLKDGGALAFYSSLNGFKQKGYEITAAVLNTSKHHIDFKLLPQHVKNLASYHLFEIDNSIRFQGAFLNLFQKDSYIISRFYHPEFEKLLISLVQKNNYDAILFESLQTTVYIDKVKEHTHAPCIYRAHNIEYKIWETQSRIEKNLVKKIYLKLQSERLAQFEQNTVLKFDAILPITPADKVSFKEMGVQKPMLVMPAGIDTEIFALHEPNNTGPVFHIGSMDWMPNQEAVHWFLKEVWPDLFKQFPDIEFYIAGRNMPEEFLNIEKAGVKVIGEVNNAYDFMQLQGLMVVPLFSGSGMRVKVVEGMAMGKCIVSTGFGMEGIFAEPGKHYYLANNANDFIIALTHLISNPAKAQQTGEEARRFAFEHFNNTQIMDQVIAFIKQIKK